jgi:hypothetical protein
MTLKMEGAFSSETSVAFQRTTRRYGPEDRSLHNHRYESRVQSQNGAYAAVARDTGWPFSAYCFNT